MRPEERNVVTLSDADVSECSEWAKELARIGIDKSGRDDDYNPAAFFVGYIGEKAMHRWCERFGIYHRHEVNLTGERAAPEFIVYRCGSPKRMDVKTRGEPDNDCFMSAVHQALDACLYVGARIESRGPSYVVRIMGVLKVSEVEALPITQRFGHKPTRWALFSDMHDPQILIPILDPVTIVKRRTAA